MLSENMFEAIVRAVRKYRFGPYRGGLQNIALDCDPDKDVYGVYGTVPVTRAGGIIPGTGSYYEPPAEYEDYEEDVEVELEVVVSILDDLDEVSSYSIDDIILKAFDGKETGL